MIWFTGDTHFSHGNIIKYCSRPFKNSREMDDSLISNWNSKISKNDVVYHLGDFCWLRNIDDISKLLNRLNFKELNIVLGNHDDFRSLKATNKFNKISQYMEIKISGNPITLMHYAMRVWNKSHFGAYMLYGHSHGTLPDDPNSLSYDVGVDNNNYYPVSHDEIVEIMSKKTFIPIDHHRPR